MLCFHVAQTGKHLLRTQKVSEQNQKHFLCSGQNLCPQQMLRARENEETFVAATMCPRLQGPLRMSSSADQEARGLWVRDCDQFLDQSCKFIAHDEGLTLETSAF